LTRLVICTLTYTYYSVQHARLTTQPFKKKMSQTQKATPTQKIESKLRDLRTDLYYGSEAVKTARKEAQETIRKFNDIQQRMDLLKSEYKDQQYAMKQLSHTLYHKRKHVGRIKHEITTTELELEIVSAEAKQKEEKKALKKTKKGAFVDPLLQNVNKLPEVLVELIGSFLPKEVVFDIKIKDLESRVKTQKLISRCSAPLKNMFLKCFSKTRQFLSLLTYEEAIEQVSIQGNRYYYVATAKESELKILRMIEMAKASDPEFAYNMLKKLHILIDPTKKYKTQKTGWYNKTHVFRPLTMEDVESSRNDAIL